MKFDHIATFTDDEGNDLDAWREDRTHVMIQAGDDGSDHGRVALTFEEARRFAALLVELVDECERYPA